MSRDRQKMTQQKNDKQKQIEGIRNLLLLTFIIFTLAGGVIFAYIHGQGTNIISPSNGIGVTTTSDNELIGLSDGSYAFDINQRAGKDIKQQAADKFKKGDIKGAESLWKQAIQIDSNDAEVRIYLEDQQVRASGTPYITLVVGTTLTGRPGYIITGRDNLQGAYVAQKEYNYRMKIGNDVQVVLLIANTGNQPSDATAVAQRIVQATKQDTHIVGVMGWPFSASAINAENVLSQAGIPMVSPTASSDSLTGISKYFFRVAPSNKSQAIAGAQYAENMLQARRAALFFDPGDPYSDSLANDFKKQFERDGNQIVSTQHYTVGNTANLADLLQTALDANPDMIYFAGDADDMSALLTHFPTSSPVSLMGGDALYELVYPPAARPGFTRLNFTAFAYPDTWDILRLGGMKPAFFTVYAQDFDTNNPSNNPYTYSRPDNDVILSYDAMCALLIGSKNALAGNTTSLTSDMLQQNLAKITGSNAFQGVSGLISFGSNGDSVNKTVVMLKVDPQGHIQYVDYRGCFDSNHVNPSSLSCSTPDPSAAQFNTNLRSHA